MLNFDDKSARFSEVGTESGYYNKNIAEFVYVIVKS